MKKSRTIYIVIINNKHNFLKNIIRDHHITSDVLISIYVKLLRLKLKLYSSKAYTFKIN